MEKLDLKKQHKALYNPPKGEFEIVDVPPLHYVQIDGAGDPNSAEAYKTGVAWLFSVSYAMKFAAKAELGSDYVVGPLEALWWADDMSTFLTRQKSDWQWTIMILQPDFVTTRQFEKAVEKTGKKLGAAPASLRLETYHEGLSVQTLHIGSYDDEAPTLARLHQEFVPGNGLKETGHHHEIYLSDPRKVAPDKLKTILRQPVRRL
ncbi:GyrI-like domain-containing protein [Devosia sp. LjRoot16]|uniref:GyrI-like domain-containing protein n=1 Tax=Devosia sp. LjRoot16 TaxID=3342271 RepID=UPI003ECC3B97